MKRDPELDKWLKQMADDSGKKIKESVAFINLLTDNVFKDPLCALQLGFAILMDKPMFLIVDKKTKIPIHLEKIARVIERVDFDKPGDMARATASVQDMIKTLGSQA